MEERGSDFARDESSGVVCNVRHPFTICCSSQYLEIGKQQNSHAQRRGYYNILVIE